MMSGGGGLIYSCISSSFASHSTNTDGCFGSHRNRVIPSTWISYKSFQKPDGVAPGASISSSSPFQSHRQRGHRTLIHRSITKAGAATNTLLLTPGISWVPPPLPPSSCNHLQVMRSRWDGVPSPFSFLAALQRHLITTITLEKNKQDREGAYNATAISVCDSRGIAMGFIY